MDQARRQELREATVVWILAARGEYLEAGASRLKHWDQIQSRLRAGARMASDAQTWATKVARGLLLGAPRKARAEATVALVETVGADADVWLRLVEEEHGYLMAMARLRADVRRASRAERFADPTSGEAF
jgi:hypothetical protein